MLPTSQTLSIVEFPPVTLQRAWTLTPVTLLYVSNVAFALMGLQNLNIPMYNTLKRLTPVIVLVVKVREGHACSMRSAVLGAGWGSSKHTYMHVAGPGEQEGASPRYHSLCAAGGGGLRGGRHWGLQL